MDRQELTDQLAARIAKRLVTEPVVVWDDRLGHISETARIAAREAVDSLHPIAATAIVRKNAVTEIAPPDVEALLAAFNRPEETP